MVAGRFELTITFPPDARFTDTARQLAVHAAKHAGLPDAQADAFGDQVAGAVGRSLAGAREDSVPVIMRRSSGPVEVLVNGRILTPDS